MIDTQLTDPQQTVLKLLAEGSTVSAAAEAAGVQSNIVSDWRANSPEFGEAWRAALLQQSAQWRDQMQVLGYEARHMAKAPKPSVSRFPLLGKLTDVEGKHWEIRDIRPTKHGFDLCYGSRIISHGMCKSGLPRLIVTEGLRDFWHVNRHKGHGVLFDLPGGRTTLKRARKRLGMNFHDDCAEFWAERIEDLKSMTPRQFAARHSINVSAAADGRLKTLGRRARFHGWWRTPETREILLSNLTLIKVGAKLNISISHSKRLRDKAKLELHAG